MKIAIAASGTAVSEHFGNAETFRIFTLNPTGQITGTEIIPGSGECGCRSGIANVLAERGVSVLLTGSMGRGSHTLLQRSKINVVRGCSGEIETVINEFLDGNLSDQGDSCTGHAKDHVEGHLCNHHHQ